VQPASVTAVLGILGGFFKGALLRDLNRYEMAGLAILMPALILLHKTRAGRWRPFLRFLPFVAPRGMRAVLLIGTLAIAARTLLLPLEPIPQPHVHDEFSFLLQADTFLHGRLANPTPPFWPHFESIHIFLTPTYASMYFPMQGLILAAGRLLEGAIQANSASRVASAWLGVLLSTGVMCGAIVWMLEAWMPPRWAFIGGLLAIARLALFSYWINGYYGGAHAVTGAALVLGAWPRLSRNALWPRLARKPVGQRRLAHCVALAAGLVILAYGRPYEGLLLSVPVAVAMFFFGDRPARDARVFVPVTLVLMVAAAALGLYCWRITGSPFKIPYEVNREQYGWPQTLLTMKADAPPIFRNVQMAQYYDWETALHAQTGSSRSLLDAFLLKILVIWSFYIGPALSLSLLALPGVLRDRRIRPLLFPAGVVLVGLLFSQSLSPHYAAPAAPVIFAVVLQGFRHLRLACLRELAIGEPLLCTAAVVVVLVLALRVATLAGLHLRVGDNSFSWCCQPAPAKPGRADFARQLELAPGNHLVFVRYFPKHSFHDEWVYNEADIPHARVIWARLLTPDEDRQLIEHYSGRHVWLLEPDAQPPRIVEWTGEWKAEWNSAMLY
jgi:hypothetical protein